MKRIYPWMLAMPAIILATATGCSTPAGTANENVPGSEAEKTVLDSCGREVVFDQEPQSVLAIGSEAPALLTAAGAGEKITHYAGRYQVPFDEETEKAVRNAQRVIEDSHDVS